MPEPFPQSICHECRHCRRVESRRGSVYLMCTEPSLPKYRGQPALSCPMFEVRGDEGG